MAASTIIIAFYACNNEASQEFEQKQRSLMVNEVINTQEEEAGDGNIQSADTTPVNQKLVVQYINNNNETLTVETSFNANKEGVVTINKPGMKPISLPQTDVWANGATYSNGNITWTAAGTTGSLTEAGKVVEYRILKQ